MAVQELLDDELIKQPNIRELPANELIEEESFLSKKGGQLIAGAQDITEFIARPLERTLGTIVYSPEQGFEAIGPEEATRRQEEGTLPGLPGASTEEPSDVLEAGLRFAGQTALIGPILGRAFGTVKAVKEGTEAVTKIGKLKQFPRKFASEAGERFKGAPKVTTAIETGLGFSAGLGGGIAQKIFPDSDAARFIGEITFGVIPQLFPMQLAIRMAGGVRNLFNKIRRPFTETGGAQRAKARTSRAVPAEKRVDVEAELDLPTTIDNVTGLPVLTPAQRTGEPGLLSLERSIMDSSEELVREADTQIANANAVIQRSITDLSDAPTSVVSDNIEAAHKYLDNLLDTRVRVAAQRTAERIEALGPSVSREQTNRIARDEIDSALAAARAQEKQLYDLIDPDVQAPFSNSLAALKRFKKELGKAQQEDIAPVAKVLATLGPKKTKFKDVAEFNFKDATPDEMVQRLADDMQVHELKASEIDRVAETAGTIGETLIARGATEEQAAVQVIEMLAEATEKNTLRVLDEAKRIALGGVQPLTTIKELRSVQSKLREVARNARSGDKKNLNEARIADDIADAITDDLAENLGGPEMADTIKTAIAFSRNLNQRFSQGTVGKILRRDVTGAPIVPAGLTLEESIGLTGPKARESFDDIVKAFDSPEAPGSGLIINASEEYLRGRFLKAAVDRGQLNINAAQRFIKQNEEILNRLPGLRRQIDEVIESGDALAVTERQRARISLDDPKVSKATMFIEKGPVDTFKQIGRLKPVDAEREMQLLINRVAKDQTGEATQGLKSGFVEFLLTGARGKARDIEGLPFLSGFALRDTLNNPSVNAMAVRLFTNEERKRLVIITQDLIRMEKRRAASAAPEGILGDRPSKVIEALSGIIGAGVGRNTARKFGLGGTVQIPGIMAGRFRDMVAAGVKDPAGRFLRDAVNDEVLFRELLEAPLDEVGELSVEATRRLNVWAFNVLAEYGGAFEEE